MLFALLSSKIALLALASTIGVLSSPLRSTSNIKPRTSSPGYGTLHLTTTGPIIHAVIDNPPINVWDYKLAHDVSSFLDSLASQNATSHNSSTSAIKVVTISSANPDYWISHYEIHVLSAREPVVPLGNATLVGSQLIHSRSLLATLPTIFIAEINGRVTGAGDEFAIQCDIRYAGPLARLSQFEIGFGLLPGAGGVQFLTKLIGRARALEYILSARAVDAVTAEAVGWVNRAFGSQEELSSEVRALADRIATFPSQGLKAIKARVNAQKPGEKELNDDLVVFNELAQTALTQETVDRYLKLSAEESNNEFERGIPNDVAQVLS